MGGTEEDTPEEGGGVGPSAEGYIEQPPRGFITADPALRDHRPAEGVDLHAMDR